MKKEDTNILKIDDYGYDGEKDLMILHLCNGEQIEHEVSNFTDWDKVELKNSCYYNKSTKGVIIK